MSSTNKKTAEQDFREAFNRLKNGEPRIVRSDASITQNNIAREAGRHPTALKKDRFPLLVLEIQAYIRSLEEQDKRRLSSQDNRTRNLKKRLTDCQNQRDKLLSTVEAQFNLIEQLQEEIVQLKSGNVVKI